MRYLAAVDTVHTAAALSDYLGERADARDEIVAVAVDDEDGGESARIPGDGDAERDRQEALNVIGVRLAVPEVETVERRGEAAEEILGVATERDVDEIVLGVRAGTADASARPGTVGSTAEAVLAEADRPVVVIPAPGP